MAFRPSAYLVLVPVLLFFACSKESEPKESGQSRPLTFDEAVTLNNHAVSFMDQQKVGEALPLFIRLKAGAPKSTTARFNLAVALLNAQTTDDAARAKQLAQCRSLLEELAGEHPDMARAHFTLGILFDYLGEERSLVEKSFRRAWELAPTDPDCCYRLGKVLFEKRPPQLKEAVQLLRTAVKLEPHFIGAWNTLALSLRRLKRPVEAKEANRLFALYQNAKPSMGKTFAVVYNQMGRLSEVIRSMDHFDGSKPKSGPPPVPLTFRSKELAKAVSPAKTWPDALQCSKGDDVRGFLTSQVAPALSGGIALGDIDGDGDLDLFSSDGRGAGRILLAQDDELKDVTEASGLAAAGGDLIALGAVMGDVDHDHDLDLYIYGAGRNLLGLNDGKGVFQFTSEFGGGDALTRSAQFVDADHDGDLDILVANELTLPAAGSPAGKDLSYPADFEGAPNFLYNNNRPTIYEKNRKSGDEPPFTDIGERTGLRGAAQHTVGLAVFDVDGDGDVDVLLQNDGSEDRLLLNDRLWIYHPAPPELGWDDAGGASGACVTDIDQDGTPDVLLSRSTGNSAVAVWNGFPNAARRRTDMIGRPALVWSGDLDNDGDPDLVFSDLESGDLVAVRQDSGEAWARPGILAKNLHARAVAIHDRNGDGLLDLLAADSSGRIVEFINTSQSPLHWLELSLKGKRELSLAEMWSNTHGMGASVEVMAGNRGVHAFSSTVSGPNTSISAPLHIGLGTYTNADAVRVLWPDLVLQSEIDFKADRLHVYEEINRKASSCPVLFKARSDGSGFEFVTDFLGVGGLGFLVGPGSYAPPDETETVRIGSLPVREGLLELRVVEPMEEITYLDALSLLAVDHSEDVEVYCDERLGTSAPFPTGRPLALRRPFLPEEARNAKGDDVLEDLLHEDRRFVKGMEVDRRFLGYLAREQRIALRFDSKEILAARPNADAHLWLILDGWVEYPYSHINFAAWQAGVEAQALSVDRKTSPTGMWETVLENVGYPGGMTRSMALDVTALASGEFEQIRLRTNLEVHVDRVRLAWEDPSAIVRSTQLGFDRAELRFLGYPREVLPEGRKPEIYDYDDILPALSWKTMGGRYTRYGDVRELLSHVDDRYVVMNHGEEIVLEVQARRLPPIPPGTRRTYFLLTDGWCKDMDPLTAAPDTVAPLPYHRMGGYPPKHVLETAPWMDTWQTRTIAPTFPRGR
ncbi:MAG TPA: hypothetical protein ENK43_09395 [Planctomycetes bacterium]|nr:hypothetical protein [Planctomycetota bacterium]